MKRLLTLFILFILVIPPVSPLTFPTGQTKVLHIYDRNPSGYALAYASTSIAQYVYQTTQQKLELIFSAPLNWDDAVKVSLATFSLSTPFLDVIIRRLNSNTLRIEYIFQGSTTTSGQFDKTVSSDSFFELDIEAVYSSISNSITFYIYLDNSNVGSFSTPYLLIFFGVVGVSSMNTASNTDIYVDDVRVWESYTTLKFSDDFEDGTLSPWQTNTLPANTHIDIKTIGLTQNVQFQEQINYNIPPIEILAVKTINFVYDITLNVIDILKQLIQIPFNHQISFNALPDILSLIKVNLNFNIDYQYLIDLLELIVINLNNQISIDVSRWVSGLHEIFFNYVISEDVFANLLQTYTITITNIIDSSFLVSLGNLIEVLFNAVIDWLYNILFPSDINAGGIGGEGGLDVEVVVIPYQPPGLGGGNNNVPGLDTTILSSDTWLLVNIFIGLFLVVIGYRYPYLLILPIYILPWELKPVPILLLVFHIVRNIRWGSRNEA